MPEARADAGARDGRFLVVALGPRRFALAAATIREVLRPPALTRIPNGPGALAGVANLRGTAVPILDLRRLVAPDAVPGAEPGRVVLADLGEPVGLLVDRVMGFVADRSGDGAAPALDLPDLIARVFPRRAAPRTAPAAERQAPAKAEQPPGGVRDERRALVTVTAAGRSYAFALDEVAAVQALPDDVEPGPGGDAAALGVVRTRGRALPLLSLAGLLGLGGGPVPEGARIVVVRVGRGEVGLVVDLSGPIRRLSLEAIEPVPAALRRRAARAVTAIGRIDDAGIVAILSAEALLADRFIAITDTAGPAPEPATDREADAEPFVVLDLAGARYGLPVAAIRAVLPVPVAMTRLPRAPETIAGIVNLRGGVLPVIDPRRLFGLPRSESGPRRRIVVLETGGPAAGLLVDSATHLLRLPARRIRPAPAPTGAALGRVADLRDGGLLPLIDPVALIAGVRASLAAGPAA